MLIIFPPNKEVKASKKRSVGLFAGTKKGENETSKCLKRSKSPKRARLTLLSLRKNHSFKSVHLTLLLWASEGLGKIKRRNCLQLRIKKDKKKPRRKVVFLTWKIPEMAQILEQSSAKRQVCRVFLSVHWIKQLGSLPKLLISYLKGKDEDSIIKQALKISIVLYYSGNNSFYSNLVTTTI